LLICTPRPPRGECGSDIALRGKINTEKHKGSYREPQRIMDPELKDHKREKSLLKKLIFVDLIIILFITKI
jgi:hypothetical protein